MSSHIVHPRTHGEQAIPEKMLWYGVLLLNAETVEPLPYQASRTQVSHFGWAITARIILHPTHKLASWLIILSPNAFHWAHILSPGKYTVCVVFKLPWKWEHSCSSCPAFVSGGSALVSWFNVMILQHGSS